jgi:hypothetical protein
MEFVFGAPVLLLMAQGPEGAREGTATEAGEGAERLSDGAAMGTVLSESGTPGGEDFEQSAQQHFVSSLRTKQKERKKRPTPPVSKKHD